MSAVDLLLWVALPYTVMGVFLLLLLWRYAYDQYGWTSKSSEVLEKRLLGWGSLLFHYGFLLVFGGHILGLLVPPEADDALGMSPDNYHLLAGIGGAIAGVVAVSGLVILVVRRLGVRRVRVTSTPTDYLTLAVLLTVMSIGLFNTIAYGSIFGEYDYRSSVGVWIRSLFLLAPDAGIMATAPLTYQAHALAGLAFFLILPFTRLVHLFSLPAPYLFRRPILYRSLTPLRRWLPPPPPVPPLF